jgi:transcriptional regulator with XRE-family HTH domain
MIPAVNQGIHVDQATAIQDGRARLKMSQEHLASAAGISARTVVRAESGFRVSGESLRSICAVLGLDSASIAPVEAPEDGGIPSEDVPAGPQAIGESVSEAAPEACAAGEACVQAGPTPRAGGAPMSRLERALALGRTPIGHLPWRRALVLHRAQVAAVVVPLTVVAGLLSWSPIIERVTTLNDTGRWILEAPASQAAAAYVNALAAGRHVSRPPVLSYFACSQADKPGSPWRMAMAMDHDCGYSRQEILVETVRPQDGSVQTVVGPVGREFGRDLARRLSGDPAVTWKVAFATGRQAQGLAWFDPREVPTQDMPRPPDAPSTWVHVTMSKAGR